jgi:hypothetical protein
MLADQIGTAIHALEQELRRLGTPRPRREELLEEVRADLRAAADDGLTPRALIGDVETFAREAIAARGWTPRPRDRWTATGIALLATAAALVVAYVLVEVLNPLFARWFQLDGRYPVAGPVLVYGILALAGLGGGLAAFARFLGGRPAARPSVLRAALLLPVGAVLGVVAAVAFGRSQDYATSAPVITTEVVLIAVPCAAALWLARWWGLRAAPDQECVSSA